MYVRRFLNSFKLMRNDVRQSSICSSGASVMFSESSVNPACGSNPKCSHDSGVCQLEKFNEYCIINYTELKIVLIVKWDGAIAFRFPNCTLKGVECPAKNLKKNLRHFGTLKLGNCWIDDVNSLVISGINHLKHGLW